MFQSSTHQPQLLPAEAYSAPEQYALEWERLFAGAWHCVAAKSDFPRVGDYRAFRIGDYPLLMRRDADNIHAYLNVCPHRFCMLRNTGTGNMPELQCQYHGWEFSSCGNTRKIPDAKSFKPLKKGMLGLTTFPVATCGDLIFVNLQQDPVPLENYLGPRAELIESWFNPAWYPMMSYDVTTNANWKAYLENGIESYHIDSVHAKTLVRRPDEATCEHELGENYTIFRSSQQDPRTHMRWLDQLSHRLLGVNPEPYTHCHIYPHFTFIRISTFTYLESIIPLSSTQSQIITRGFAHRGEHAGFVRRLSSRIAGRTGAKLLKDIQDEDCAILDACQQGLQSPRHPTGGLISTREERIHHFQSCVLQATNSEPTTSELQHEQR